MGLWCGYCGGIGTGGVMATHSITAHPRYSSADLDVARARVGAIMHRLPDAAVLALVRLLEELGYPLAELDPEDAEPRSGDALHAHQVHEVA